MDSTRRMELLADALGEVTRYIHQLTLDMPLEEPAASEHQRRLMGLSFAAVELSDTLCLLLVSSESGTGRINDAIADYHVTH